MSEAKRYTVTANGRNVFECVEGVWVADCHTPKDAARITRLLNAEAEVVAALREAQSYIRHIEESGAFGKVAGVTVAAPRPTLLKVQSALSALGEE